MAVTREQLIDKLSDWRVANGKSPLNGGTPSVSPGGAYDEIVAIFQQYGLDELAQTVLQLVQDGYEGNALTLQLQESEPYKKRFAGNELRKKNGLPVLTPAEYLEVEVGYRQAIQAYGLDPRYGEQSYLANLMGKDLSPREVSERIGLAGAAARTADPNLKAAMREYYGVADEDLLDYFLDEELGSEILKKQAVASEVGAAAAAARARLSRSTAELLAERGIGGTQIAGSLNDVDLDAERAIASRFGQQLTDDEVVSSEVGVDAAASQKRKRLASQERALFSRQGLTQTSDSRGRSY